MKILAIGAHPDDIEIFMYGTLALFKKQGHHIFLGIATDGAAGKLQNSKNLKEIRKKEAISGLKNLGKPKFLDLPDGMLSYAKNSQLIINNYIQNVEPNMIITHSFDDYHPDHRSLSSFVTESAGFKCPVLYADTLMGVNFLPEIYVDVSDVFQSKLDAIAKHKSQRPNNFISAITILNRFRSAQCNGPEKTYAEGYKVSKTFPFSDIRNFLPKAPKYRPYYSQNSDGLI